MHRTFVKAVAMILLLVQAVVGVAPGQVVCMPLGGCAHESVVSAGCGHCGEHRHVAVAQDQPERLAAAHNDDCGCHLHVAIPADERVPGNPRGEGVEARVVFMAGATMVPGWGVAPPASTPAFHPPDFRATDQVRSLKATRLII
jgi:hypothetical protein